MRLTIGPNGSRLDLSDGSDSLRIDMERPALTFTDPDVVRDLVRSLDHAQLGMRRNDRLGACPVCGTTDHVGFGREGCRWYAECRRCGIRTRPNPIQAIAENDWNDLRRP